MHGTVIMNSHVRKRFEEIIVNLKKERDKKAEPFLLGGLKFLVNVILDEMSGFANVTGNTRNSIAVALYNDRKLVGVATSFDALHKAPTRMTLVHGETYDLSHYWDGTPVEHLGSPYKAPDDSPQEENFWAQEEALEFMQSQAPKGNGWRYKVVAATDYAKYLETKQKANVLTQVRDELAGMGAEVTRMNE